ncbi:PPE domain-containing protein [Mycolicibacterium brumae]|uniref:PPE domain-containing protein n=1 Tax=Mycolicibacterium brumae TaxID=85968 RepID=A0A2G5PA42_9MYCO|nr:PPE domain-containing protein [Mycolicibacterium brumae]MCV7192922.1 PPE domain-containing protein [Mycolicibacterium brumae]PIB75239.1 PPE domain-containing protein [Mycolicibacterium brumae]RWA23511.1 hypothetical protein MBRU_01420 [Mycolicibacterium brumae DSM 44177]UWW08559.1 PPE family protein [Mycolicibacterium brumae]
MTDFWAVRPPEVNDLALRGGTGIATTSMAALTYVMEIAGVEAAAGVSLNNAATLAPEFVGLAGAGSMATGTMLNTTLELLGGWLIAKPPVFATAINAYLTATSTMIPAPVCVENRTEWEALCAANIPALGMLTPRIIEKDLEYFGGMWPNNAGVGTSYSAALMTLIPALSIPPPITGMGASPAAPAEAGAAVAEATASGAVGEALQAGHAAANLTTAGSSSGSMSDVMSQVTGAVQQAGEAGTQLGQSLFGLPTQLPQAGIGLLQAFPGLFGSLGKSDDSVAPELSAAVLADGPRPSAPAPAVAGLGPTAGYSPTPGAATGLSSYTRPTSGFAPDPGGRPTGLRSAGALTATEARAPVTGGAPVAPGMLARSPGSAGVTEVARVRVVAEPRNSRN